MSVLLIERAGLLSTIQDRGRPGWQHLGVPVSGWMDDLSARLANRLAGNPDGAALIEVTLAGPSVMFERAACAAVTGAVFELRVDGQSMRSPCRFHLGDGARVEFLARQSGARAYFAIAGGIGVEPVLGSRATDVRSGLGGVSGRRLQRGDRLPLGVPSGRPVDPRELAPAAWLGERRLRMLPVGDDATRRALAAALVARTFHVAPASDRTGYRLTPDRPLPATAASLASQPVVTGAIQVPPDGEPVLLMADRQTTGGYLVPAVVATCDLAVAAQLAPGDPCSFDPCSRDQASARADVLERELNAIAGPIR